MGQGEKSGVAIPGERNATAVLRLFAQWWRGLNMPCRPPGKILGIATLDKCVGEQLAVVTGIRSATPRLVSTIEPEWPQHTRPLFFSTKRPGARAQGGAHAHGRHGFRG